MSSDRIAGMESVMFAGKYPIQPQESGHAWGEYAAYTD